MEHAAGIRLFWSTPPLISDRCSAIRGTKNKIVLRPTLLSLLVAPILRWETGNNFSRGYFFCYGVPPKQKIYPHDKAGKLLLIISSNFVTPIDKKRSSPEQNLKYCCSCTVYFFRSPGSVQKRACNKKQEVETVSHVSAYFQTQRSQCAQSN